MSSPAMLTTRQLVRTFGSLRAVDGVDLAVGEHTITGLIGPNGAGKTTLFNLIACGKIQSSPRCRYSR
ncbi:MAG TPA: ATP-binding cassette domain-containing protein [Burkholderiales bacterium]|nr:ATP-binding cassette domain-containing protein [Burkholderiales bacterium]